jgi:glyoxylase-like metal-dependent hydrolase (beta-lactamase superfamily II)
MERRKFLGSCATLVGTLPFINLNKIDFLHAIPSSEIARTKIGKFNCTIFRDYMYKYLAKDFFINANAEELTQILNQNQINPDNISSPFTPILIQQDNKKILIDTGIGFSDKPAASINDTVIFHGRLLQLFQEENIKRDDITDIIITHFHPDHIGGIFADDGKLNFPNAKFHIHEDEWNYWHSSQSDNQPAMFKHFVEKNITNLKDRDLDLIKGDFIEVLQGMTVVKAGGHTPGHMAVIIHSENEHLLYLSDTFLHPLHIQKLDWQTSYDMDHEKAKQSRVKILELANKENMIVSAYHFNFPGLGRIDRHENNWTWKYSAE